ncbi:MAG: exodeoxyribonuclease VII small subunit [Lachnospiraceae bacterium]|nr:exodeoxyribonuclease VII small subunit [Lachnospiraceae bacterium]MDY4068332.1 exodeoxyribonuclease VII small subunit [Lachnospiraceae bacterium]
MSVEKTGNVKPEITLEEAFDQLEQIIGQLEDEEITLDQSFMIYKEGMELLKYCNDTLDTVEKQVLKINESGELDEF